MNSKIQSLIKYICQKYPHNHELSNARLTKMIYLADWEFARLHGRQLTDIEWFFNNYGPYVDDVVKEAERAIDIDVISTTTIYGTPKVQINYHGDGGFEDLDADEVSVLNKVISDTKPMYWNDFIRYVYSTYPIMKNPRYTSLNLIELAEAEKSEHIQKNKEIFNEK